MPVSEMFPGYAAWRSCDDLLGERFRIPIVFSPFSAFSYGATSGTACLTMIRPHLGCWKVSRGELVGWGGT